MTSASLQTRIGFATEAGKRKTNEDYVASLSGDSRPRAVADTVAVIADGMGGGPGGRLAAETTARGFLDAYFSLPETLGVDRAAARALSALNRWVHAQGRQDRSLENMATTFTALILRGRQAHVVHVGDTRVYRLREHRLQQLTQDHSHPHPDLRHVLYRAVGLEQSVRAEYATHRLKLHDRFLLCTDGAHGSLSDNRLRAILDERASPEEGAQRLVEAALAAGSQDNVSALVLDVVEVPPANQSDIELALAALPIRELPKVGEVVDEFRLMEVISDGRYSRLFRAEDNVEPRELTLKFPHPRVTTEAAYRHAFVREAWVASQVRSPYITEVVELPPKRQTRLYSVMPYYTGETLEQRLSRQPPVSLEEGVDIGIKLAKAVYALNRQRIIHRDIKPENVLLTETDKKVTGLKLLDLGVARLPGIEDVAPTEIPGTPSYMAPELFDGQAGDEATEVYALGVTLYRLFSAGHYPYGEIEAFSHPRFTKRQPLMRYRPDMPAWVDAVLGRCLMVEPGKRFADAMELAFELENGLVHGAKMMAQRLSLYERNPLRFWQVVSALLALALLFVLNSS
jgi:serine/threonine protein phosphatase PrpC